MLMTAEKPVAGQSAFSMGWNDANECIGWRQDIEEAKYINPFPPKSFLYEQYDDGWKARWLNIYEGANENLKKAKRRK